jgi:hypothetical protein
MDMLRHQDRTYHTRICCRCFQNKHIKSRRAFERALGAHLQQASVTGVKGQDKARLRSAANSATKCSDELVRLRRCSSAHSHGMQKRLGPLTSGRNLPSTATRLQIRWEKMRLTATYQPELNMDFALLCDSGCAWIRCPNVDRTPMNCVSTCLAANQYFFQLSYVMLQPLAGSISVSAGLQF